MKSSDQIENEDILFGHEHCRKNIQQRDSQINFQSKWRNVELRGDQFETKLTQIIQVTTNETSLNILHLRYLAFISCSAVTSCLYHSRAYVAEKETAASSRRAGQEEESLTFVVKH